MDNRIVFLDWLRAIACLMVIVIHSVEPFYLDSAGTFIATATDGIWCAILDSPFRSAVPLFVLASSYLLFPLRQPASVFFRRRTQRVLVPLIVWVVVYALAFDPTDCLYAKLPFNFTASAGHLWFVFMLMGVYLAMWLLSPWIERCSRREEKWFLRIWGFTLVIPFIRQLSVYLNGSWAVWGEASWNEFGMFYYVSGFIGYVVLGHYLRTYVPKLPLWKVLAWSIPLLLIGYAVNAFGFLYAMPDDFPVRDSIRLAVNMETAWRFCSLGVAVMTVGYFMLIRMITSDGMLYRKIILPISKCSYGAYLLHIIVLIHVCSFVRPWCEDALGTLWSMPVCVLVTASVTYVISISISYAISRIPVVGKFIVG